MDKNIVIACAVSLVLSVVVAMPPIGKASESGTTLFSDDFESYSIGTFPSTGGWILVWNGQGTGHQVVSDAYSFSPTKSLQLWGRASWSSVAQRKFSTDVPVIGYECAIRIDSIGTGGPGREESVAFFNRDVYIWGRGYAAVLFNHDDGEIKAEDGTVLGDWQPGVWYRVKVVLDRRTNTYAAWIDGQLKGQGLSTISADTDNINALALMSDHAGVKVYYDDARVFTVDAWKASNPYPANGATDVSPNVILSWDYPYGYISPTFDVYLGTNFDAVYNAKPSDPEYVGNVGRNQYHPFGPLDLGETYYWRADTVVPLSRHKGDVWSFTTISGPAKATNPYPADGAADVPTDVVLSWTPGYGATSHDVYFGTSSPPAFIGNQAASSYDPGTLEPGTTYYWQINEVVPMVDGPPIIHEGNVWSFTTSPVREEWIRFIPGAEPGAVFNVILKSSDNAGIAVDSDIPGMYSVNVSVEGDIYQKLSSPHAGRTMEVGKPKVPVIRKYLEIPHDVDVTEEVIYSDFRVLDGYNVYPTQWLHPPIQTNVTPEFAIDNETYSTDEFYPPSNAFIEEPIIIRDHRIVGLTLCPIQFNPVTKQLKVYSKIEVRINYDRPAQIEGIEERLVSEPVEELCEAFVLNYKSPDRYLTRRYKDVGSPAAHYLIITHDDFTTQVQPLADWKQKKGYETEIVTTSTTGSTACEIKQYIQNAYDSWDPPPTYVLLVGDVKISGGANGIPTYYGLCSCVVAGGRIGTDLYYAMLDGDDYYPDIFVGRLSVKTANEAETVINKILTYEKSPVWAGHGLVCWSDGWWCWPETSEKIMRLLDAKGYTYTAVEGGNGALTQQIKDTINDGCFIVTHNDHGNSRNAPGGNIEGWGDPRFTSTDVYDLTNGNKLPVMFSMNCRTGWFDGETDDDDWDPLGGVDCLGEAWLKANNKGGVAFIGSSRASNMPPSDFMCLGFYDAIWPEPTQNAFYKLGQVLTYGKIHLVLEIGYNAGPDFKLTKRHLEEFNLLGDPEMSIWTEQPQSLTVTHPSTIGSGGSQEFVVKVTDGVDPVVHALVGLYKDNDVHTFDYTDAGGHVTFDIPPFTAGNLDITVTKHNYLPYEGVITVTDGGAVITELLPNLGVPDQPFRIRGEGFSNGETVDTYFDTTFLCSTSATNGEIDVIQSVPSSYPEGPANVIAIGQGSGRAAVAVFTVLPPQPLPDPYTYSQWDSSTWHLNPSGGDPVWDNPCIRLYEASTGKPVSSGDLRIGTTYTIEATIYNFATVPADYTQVTFKWAQWGIGQPLTLWDDIGIDTVNVPAAPGSVQASVNWKPIITGHSCIVVEVHHPLDFNTNNNKGQENTDVHPVTSPAEIFVDVYNPTETPALVYLEVTQSDPCEESELWETRIERAYPQVLEPNDVQTATLRVVAPEWAEIGESRVITVTGSINGETIGGVEFQVVKVAECLVIVDDFEDYSDTIGNRIFETWEDGYGYGDVELGYPGNGTGSMVDISTDVIRGGAQSMRFTYNNSGRFVYYSETKRTFDTPQSWTIQGVKALSLWFYGDPNNDPEQLYVAVEDNMGMSKLVNHTNPNAVLLDTWQEWNIDLQEFSDAGVNLASIRKVYVGVGDRHNPQPGGTGTMYFDDIRLGESTEETEEEVDEEEGPPDEKPPEEPDPNEPPPPVW